MNHHQLNATLKHDEQTTNSTTGETQNLCKRHITIEEEKFHQSINTTSPKTTKTQRKLLKDCITKKKYAQNFLVRAFESFSARV